MSIVEWKKDRIGSAHRGENPMVITKMRSGFSVIGDTQFLPGYCVLLPKQNVATLEDLDFDLRSQYLLDMSLLGEAVKNVCQPRRVNYSIYGNTDPFLHAHIFPRYDWEPKEMIPYPVWRYPNEKWSDATHQYNDTDHRVLKEKIKVELNRLMEDAYK